MATIYSTKQNALVQLPTGISIFTTKANISGSTAIVLWGLNENTTAIFNNNTSKKTLKAQISRKSDEHISNAGIKVFHDSEDALLTIGGKNFLYNFNISAKNSGTGSAEATAIYAEKIASGANFKGSFTVSAQSSAQDASSYGINTFHDGDNTGTLAADNFSGKFKISAKGGNDAYAYGLKVYKLTTASGDSNNLTGSFSVSAKAGEKAYAYGIRSESILYTDSFSGAISVSASGKRADIAGIKTDISNAGINLNGKNSGKISVSASVSGSIPDEVLEYSPDQLPDHMDAAFIGQYASTAAAIQSASKVVINGYSGAISAKATSKTAVADVYGIYSQGGEIRFIDDHTGKLTVSVTGKKGGAGNVYGLNSSDDVVMKNISGSWSISTTGAALSNADPDAVTDEGNTPVSYSNAFGIYAAKDISLGKVSGTKKITSKYGNAYGFYAGNGEFEAESVSGKITVSGKNDAAGIYAEKDTVSVGDMSKMTLSVSASAGDACGFVAKYLSSDADLNLGKVSVSAKENAVGIVTDAVYINDNGLLTGSLSVSSKSSDAIGISGKFYYDDNQVSVGTKISVSAKNEAVGIHLYEGDLILDGAKITAKSKNGQAYSVHSTSGKTNKIVLTGNSALTGSIIDKTGGSDTVKIYHGSSLKGGMQGVETLELVLNDASKKKKALWNITSDLGDDLKLSINTRSGDPESVFGLHGDFLLATKSKKLAWDDILAYDVYGDIYASFDSNSLYKYSVYTKKNNLYFKSEINTDAPGYFNSKSSSGYTSDKFSGDILFTSKATISTKDAFAIALGTVEGDKLIVLDNSITVNAAASNAAAALYSDADDKYTVYSGNAAKSIKVTNKYQDAASNACGYYHNGSFSLGGNKFLQNITVSSQNANHWSEACGINATKGAFNAGNITGKWKISAKGCTLVSAYGIYLYRQAADIDNISGSWSVSATDTSKGNSSWAGSYGICSRFIDMEKLSGKISVSAKSKGTAWGYALHADDIDIASFTGSLTVSASGSGENIAAGIYAYSTSTGSITLNGKNSGKISVSLTNLNSPSKSIAAAIYAKSNQDDEGSVDVGSYSGAISVKAVSNNADADAYGIFGSGDITFTGNHTGKLTVSVTGKKGGTGKACGLYSENGDVTMKDISGSWSISSSGATTSVSNTVGIYAGKDISLDNVSGTKKITSKYGNAYGFYAGNGKFHAESISGKITVSGKNDAAGIYAEKNTVYAGDMSKMTLSVSASAGEASGIYAKYINFTDEIWHLGKISVSASGMAKGIETGAVLGPGGGYSEGTFYGTISATSKKDNAYGFMINSSLSRDFTFSTKITATGKSAATALYYTQGTALFDSASITAKVKDKKLQHQAFAIRVANDNTKSDTIKLTGKSKVSGHIYTGDGSDTVVIEAGSKLSGSLQGVENLNLIIDDASQKKNAFWNVAGDIDIDNTTALDIDFELGLTGDFLLATKKSSLAWDEVLSDEVKLTCNGIEKTLDLSDAMDKSLKYTSSCVYEDEGYDFELKAKGNKLILSVGITDK